MTLRTALLFPGRSDLDLDLDDPAHHPAELVPVHFKPYGFGLRVFNKSRLGRLLEFSDIDLDIGRMQPCMPQIHMQLHVTRGTDQLKSYDALPLPQVLSLPSSSPSTCSFGERSPRAPFPLGLSLPSASCGLVSRCPWSLLDPTLDTRNRPRRTLSGAA